MLQKFFRKRKEKNIREYRLARKAVIFHDAVHWLSPFFPVMEEVEKLMEKDVCMSMARRWDIFEKCGVGGISLAQLIVLNERIHQQLGIVTGWSTCQLKGDVIAPIAYTSQIDPLFITDFYKQRMSVPTITIYVGQITDLAAVQQAVMGFITETRFNTAVFGPKIIVTQISGRESAPFHIATLEATPLPRIRKIHA